MSSHEQPLSEWLKRRDYWRRQAEIREQRAWRDPLTPDAERVVAESQARICRQKESACWRQAVALNARPDS